MGGSKLRNLVLLEMHLLWVMAPSVHGQSASDHRNVIDLLAALNTSHRVGGVTRLQSPDGATYRFRPRAPFLTLPAESTRSLGASLRGAMGVHVAGHQSSGSGAALLSLSSASSWMLRIASSTLDGTLRVDYRTGGGAPASARFPGRNPFSGDAWVQLAVSLEPDRLVFFVDCREAVVVPLGSGERMDLAPPKGVVVTLGGTPGEKDSKFNGHLKAASISTHAYLKRPWLCSSVTDLLPPSQHADAQNPDSQAEGGRRVRPDGVPTQPHADPSGRYLRDFQGDQLQRGSVLGPPGPPQGAKPVSQAQSDDRLNVLEKKLDALARMLDMVKSQNADLQSRIQHLEGCECVTRRCVWEGRDVDDGQRWRADVETVCTCAAGKVTCQADIQGCVFSGVRYEHGAEWRPEDPCDVCRCVEGRVRCEREPCHTPCKNPAAPPPGTCCPVCQGCGVNGHDFPNGAVIPTGDRCLECTCESGSVACVPLPCPASSCQNPVHRAGDCCPRCEQCEYESGVYADGQEFSSRRDPCLRCRCSVRNGRRPPVGSRPPALNHASVCLLHRLRVCVRACACVCVHVCVCAFQGGNVVCHTERCPPLRCSNPVTDPRLCCLTCKACVVDGVEFAEGATWQPEGPCSNCSCVDGRALCSETRCPPAACPHAATPAGSCCAACDGCTFNRRVYSDGQRFLEPEQPCHICLCHHGSVTCEPRACPPLNCTDPHTPPGECCPKCPDCFFENRVFVDGEAFPGPVGACEDCRCASGRVDCRHAQCPRPHCNSPRPGTCCRNNCNGCSYAGKEYPNGQEFPHPTDTCRTCSCINGNIQCLMKRCPPLPCSNPNLTPGECCPQCPAPPADCAYEQRAYRHAERFYHPSDACRLCACANGTVRCRRRPCPFASCSHPITRECCRSCEGCAFRGREYPDASEFPDDGDPCGVCHCHGGEVSCSRMPCHGECSHPYKPRGQCCGECERCFYNGAALANGHSFPDSGNPCAECTCQSGSVRCVRRPCPAAACPHPALDGCGCGVCDGCSFHGRGCFSGERFPHPADRCQLCSCLSGAVVCAHAPCPSVACGRPVTPPGQCCPVCTGVCLHQGTEYQSGSTFTPPADPCSSCTCLNEAVSCQKRPCAVRCSHPLPSETCCPPCDSCLYEGAVHAHGRAFAPSGDPCQRCTCLRGSVTCVPLVCPPTPCARPVTKPGQCCPECTVCMLDGLEFSDGQSWTLGSNHCSTCTCQAGEVLCASSRCPGLPCVHQVTDPGACCPRCRGCVYEGEERAEGSSWFADAVPCMSCMCVDGVTTCSEVRCLSPCINFISVPGECCPVCADCVFEGRVYGPGDSFNPAGDPCQICTCEVMPDGEQHLRCYRKQCPSLVDCPKSNMLFTGPDSCCPVCAQPLSNCTAALIGNEVLATDDPCFTCQCKDLTWTCLHQTCLPLTCPVNEQFIPPDSCCPVCKADCVIQGTTRVDNGSIWKDGDDDCITCSCNSGYIECNIEECLPLDCPTGHKGVKVPGKCCYECQASGGSCSHLGTVYHSNEQWEVDECTECVCVSGDVHCHSERCPPLTCATDEMPAVVPGLCCPHCLPRPATCIAFGDPHYRTFDGRMLHFQGACTYVLAQDCEGGDFSIHATNDDRGRSGVSWTKEVTVFIGDITVQLLQDWVVKVNDEAVTLPFLREPFVYVERQTNTILLNTNIGLKVLWSGRSHLEVSVPGSYRSRTCGLCGNFNSFHQDDLRMPGGGLALSESAFGNSWRVTNSSRSPSSCRPGEDVDPCADAGYQAKKQANARCAVLKSGAFRACHRAVPPEPWYGACVYDLCACGADGDECLCDALEAYAARCREAGVVLRWRSPSLCAVGCPAERGFVFDECGPPCPVTCFNADAPLGVMESHCFKPCVPGCQCPAGLVLHNHYCVQREKCPKVTHGNSSQCSNCSP
ncbi:kielin/chordin-like protein isoform X2 [Betta splendens]|uniref:Kielin/chordin-like protein isoform X2 n=1 Tax=Betta splendens TaxID=158456 RepID=A0A9W2XWM9_BETSP|nr:kielin/chordin-like protein isoform X2 [Betta splendens]